jgi:hypothetical protein
MNQQRAQITIAALADAQQHRAPTAGAVAWNQSEIGREFAPALEVGGVADGGDQGGGDQRTHAFHRGCFETLSEIESRGYTLGENCQSSTGFMAFTVSSDDVCDVAGTVYLDFAVAQQGEELTGACYPDTDFDCSFEGWKQ